MKLRKAVLTILGAVSAAALVGHVGAGSTTIGGVTFSDVNLADSEITGGSGNGSTVLRGEFQVEILGQDACIKIDDLTGGKNLAPAALYSNSIALDIDVLNSSGDPWINVQMELMLERCEVASPDTDQFSFAQNEGAPLRPPAVDVGHTLFTDEVVDKDFIRFDLDSPLANTGSLGSTFVITNGSALGGPITDPLYLRISYNVPEPASVGLLGLGALGLFFRRRRA
ncbi:MAG TPA: PEP-CTERM sorting domain-containing protein [Verrucomicrobiales bacterium]|nr:PEP-CTERM sorting domain-containing protein [Verrucomicrobiales bacterium]